jgi:hypothetical protein
MQKRSSRCSAGGTLTFAWSGKPSPEAADQIDAAVRTFEDVARTPERIWDPRHWAITRAEFRNLLIRATNGRLIPLTHVKEIDRARREFVFEIKYDFRAISLDAKNKRVGSKVKTRTYTSEPPEFADSFVGLHVHQKIEIPGDNAETNRLQNVEIDVAVRYYELGRPNNWGLG